MINNMNFGEAIAALKAGYKVSRSGWNGKEMYLTLIRAGNAMHQGFPMQDCIGMKTANGLMQPGWLASQADMLSGDWTSDQPVRDDIQGAEDFSLLRTEKGQVITGAIETDSGIVLTEG